MSGWHLDLVNPLTLDFGLHFSGGGITSDILDIFGDSSQTALMTVSNTTINNFGSYDITLVSSNAFSKGSSTFNNSGTLILQSTDGTLSFSIALNNACAVSAESGVANLVGGGTILWDRVGGGQGPSSRFRQLYFSLTGLNSPVQAWCSLTMPLPRPFRHDREQWQCPDQFDRQLYRLRLSDNLTITGSGVLTTR